MIRPFDQGMNGTGASISNSVSLPGRSERGRKDITFVKDVFTCSFPNDDSKPEYVMLLTRASATSIGAGQLRSQAPNRSGTSAAKGSLHILLIRF